MPWGAVHVEVGAFVCVAVAVIVAVAVEPDPTGPEEADAAI